MSMKEGQLMIILLSTLWSIVFSLIVGQKITLHFIIWLIHCIQGIIARLVFKEQMFQENMDRVISIERNKYFRRIFSDDKRRNAYDEYANFSLKSGLFDYSDSITGMYATNPRKW